MKYNLVTIIGPTASGKTSLAVNLANQLHSSVISADSRQVYKDMNLGTGKDLNEYIVDGKQIPYYLIDICEAGEKYNVYEFQNDFIDVFLQLHSAGEVPVLCGGSGLYVEAVLKGYKMLSVPVNEELRSDLSEKTHEELVNMLVAYRPLHNTTDIISRKRLIRAIEIEKYHHENKVEDKEYPSVNPVIFGVDIERDARRDRISKRLSERLKNGMVDEVKTLLDHNVSSDDLIYYGLEYKFITFYLTGQLTYQEMFRQLEIAIHQFAKRQMTWFRKMEKDGFVIHWIDYRIPLEEKVDICMGVIKKG